MTHFILFTSKSRTGVSPEGTVGISPGRPSLKPLSCNKLKTYRPIVNELDKKYMVEIMHILILCCSFNLKSSVSYNFNVLVEPRDPYL